MYGKELILDIHDCTEKFTRNSIKNFIDLLVYRIGMEAADFYWWDYDDPDEKAAAPSHLKGTSAVQFITTSTIVIHTLDDLNKIYLNVFSCKDFESTVVVNLAEGWFGGKVINKTEVVRD